VTTAIVRLPQLASAGDRFVAGAIPGLSIVVVDSVGLGLGKHVVGTSGSIPGDTWTLAVNVRPGSE
jgi:hypothetical protein